MRTLLAAAFLAATAIPAAAATVITVANVGSILNQSLALPAEATPGSGVAFAEFFEFSLPTKEIVTLSVSDSGIGPQRIVGGVLGLNFFTSTGPAPLDIPAGALIDSTAIVNGVGGQDATLEPNVLNAGAYFAEVSGVSGASPIKLAIDGTVTAVATPEPSTWAMLVIGFGFMAWAGRRNVSRIWVDSLT